MFVTVKYFGIPVDFLSGGAKRIEIPQAATVEQLLEHICAQLEPRDAELLKSASIMVNKAQTDRHSILSENDEIIIMRVLGGG